MASNRARLKIYILSFIQMVDTTAFSSPAWHNGKLLDILRWLEENEYLKKLSMLNIYSIIPLSMKNMFQIDLISAQSFVSGRAMIHPQV